MELNWAKSVKVRLSILLGMANATYLLVAKSVIAAPENFNPELESAAQAAEIEDAEKNLHPVTPTTPPEEPVRVPPINRQKKATVPLPAPTINNEASITSGTADIELKTKKPTKTSASSSSLEVNSLTLDFQLDLDNFGQTNLLTNQKIDFNLFDLDLIFDTGVNLFKQDDIETVNNIPLYLSWETAIGKTDLTVTGGVDFFDRLAAVPTATIKASSPLFSSVAPNGKLQSLFVLSGQVRYQAYKFNAEALENEISSWRFTPSVYWQITPDLSLFSLGQYGNFNDGNQELQSFSRLEKKLGSFSVAANLFTWNFESDLSTQSGYFSPTDFLVYNGELGWQGTMFDEVLNCKLSAAFGKQTLEGTTDNAWTYKALCRAQLLDNLKLDLGYTYSNVRDRNTGHTSFGNQTIKGTLDIKL